VLPNRKMLAVHEAREYVMTDCFNHAVRVVTHDGAVRTLAGNVERGLVDGQCAAARFSFPMGLEVDVDESIGSNAGR